MKILLQPNVRRSGFALIMVMIIVAASLMILASDMSRSQTVAIQNNHNVDFSA